MGLKDALVSIDAVATNAAIAGTIRRAGADYLLAIKANQPTLRSEVEALFAAAEPAALDSATDLDKGHRASRSAPSPWPATSTGLRARGAFPASCACRTWPVWCGAHPAPSWRTWPIVPPANHAKRVHHQTPGSNI